MLLAHNLVRSKPPFSCGEPSPVHQTTSKGLEILVSTWAWAPSEKDLHKGYYAKNGLCY